MCIRFCIEGIKQERYFIKNCLRESVMKEFSLKTCWKVCEPTEVTSPTTEQQLLWKRPGSWPSSVPPTCLGIVSAAAEWSPQKIQPSSPSGSTTLLPFGPGQSSTNLRSATRSSLALPLGKGPQSEGHCPSEKPTETRRQCF